jgi:hypothetical protein
MDAFLSIHRVLASVTAHRSIAVRRPFAAESIDRRVRWFGKLKIPHLRCYGARAVLSLCARTARAVTCTGSIKHRNWARCRAHHWSTCPVATLSRGTIDSNLSRHRRQSR